MEVQGLPRSTFQGPQKSRRCSHSENFYVRNVLQGNAYYHTSMIKEKRKQQQQQQQQQRTVVHNSENSKGTRMKTDFKKILINLTNSY